MDALSKPPLFFVLFLNRHGVLAALFPLPFAYSAVLSLAWTVQALGHAVVGTHSEPEKSYQDLRQRYDRLFCFILAHPYSLSYAKDARRFRYASIGGAICMLARKKARVESSGPHGESRGP